MEQVPGVRMVAVVVPALAVQISGVVLANRTGLPDAPLPVVVPHTSLINETMTETVNKIMI